MSTPDLKPNILMEISWKSDQKLKQKRDQYLTFTTPWANSADNKSMIFFLFFSANRIWHFMQIVSNGDNLHEMSKPVCLEKIEK